MAKKKINQINFYSTDEAKLLDQIKSQADSIINLLLIGTCQRQRVMEDAERLLELVDQLESHLKTKIS